MKARQEKLLSSKAQCRLYFKKPKIWDLLISPAKSSLQWLIKRQLLLSKKEKKLNCSSIFISNLKAQRQTDTAVQYGLQFPINWRVEIIRINTLPSSKLRRYEEESVPFLASVHQRVCKNTCDSITQLHIEPKGLWHEWWSQIGLRGFRWNLSKSKDPKFQKDCP